MTGQLVLQPENDAKKRGLARAVRADQPDELAGLNGEAHVVEDPVTGEHDGDTVHVENRVNRAGLLRAHSFVVDLPEVTASSSAVSSASIQPW